METNPRLEYVVSTLFRYRKLWIYPAVAGLIISAVYVFIIKSPTWTARQSLIIRDDLLGQSYKPGQFSSLESMKSAQETILEVARKPQVIRNALVQLGPASRGWFASTTKDWISDELIEDVQGAITFSAPNGAEFGKTEVIILNTKGSSRERALRFNQFLLQEMDKKISEVRVLRLQSMESELIEARDAAALSLDESIKRLRQMESGLGADVSTMNGLNSTESGDGGVRREISEIRKERRLVESELVSALTTEEMLRAANLNPEKMFATSSEFLKTQPTLEALKKSYVTLQETKSKHNGQYTPEHPLLKSSTEAIWAMRQQMYQELETLTAQVNSRIRVLESRIRELDNDIESEIQRLSLLGTKRVDHLTINSVVKEKAKILNQRQSELAEIQALRMASGRVEWLTRVDAPQVATRPDGMGKKATILGGATCGLMMGLGLVMLLAPPQEEPQRGRPGRRTDLPRREEDRRLESPSLDEIVGPTAASAIQSASAATAATVNRGVELAKNAFGKPKLPTEGISSDADSNAVEPSETFPETSPVIAEDVKTTEKHVPTLAKTANREVEPAETASISVTFPHLSETESHEFDRGSIPDPNGVSTRETANPSDVMGTGPASPHKSVEAIDATFPSEQRVQADVKAALTEMSERKQQSSEDSVAAFGPGNASRKKANRLRTDFSSTDELEDRPVAPSAPREPVSGSPQETSQAIAAEMQLDHVDSQKIESVLASFDAVDRNANAKIPAMKTNPVNPGKSDEKTGDQRVVQSLDSKSPPAPGSHPNAAEPESVKSARTILEEIKAKSAAKQHQGKQHQGTGTVVDRKIELNANPARIQRKASNQRPIDLAKSVEEPTEIESATNASITPREDCQTQRIDNLMASVVLPEFPSAEPSPSPVEPPTQQSGENPFLQNLPRPKPNSAGDATKQVPDSATKGATVDKASTETRSSTTKSESRNTDTAETMPMSEQIKNISDSIARYTKKQKPGSSDAGSPDSF